MSYKGKDGDPGGTGPAGEDALEIIVTPQTLTFDTDEHGAAVLGTDKTAKITCRVKGADVTGKCSSFAISDKKNCDASVSGNSVSITRIVSDVIVGSDGDAVTDADGNQMNVARTGGGVVVKFNYSGREYTAEVRFVVNVNAYYAGLVNSNKEFKQTYGEITNTVNKNKKEVDAALATKADTSALSNYAPKSELTELKSSITQTARNIALEVSQKAVGRRNLLVGSAFRKQDDGPFSLSPTATIEKNSGIDGTNCLRARNTYNGSSATYIGAYWDGSLGAAMSVKIERGKKYTISCWIKCDRADVNIALESIYTDKQTSATRKTRPKTTNGTFRVSKANTWELVSCVIDTSLQGDGTTNTQYDYVAINFWVVHTLTDSNGKGITATAYFCKPMLEEGDTYNGWTLSEQDYDYVGGNLLDNVRTLIAGGTLEYAKNVVSQGYGYDSAVAHEDNSNGSTYSEVMCWLTTLGSISFQNKQDYVLSFLAKGSGTLTCYMYCRANNTSHIYSENSQGWVTVDNNDGTSNFTLTNEWKRYWVHFRVLTDSPLPTDILFRATIGCNVYVTQPKLEEGATMTEWTECKTDLIDKASLKAAGILVDANAVTLYGNQVHIKNTKDCGDDTVLIDTNTGKVSAGLIDAKTVVTNGLQANTIDAKEATISNLNVENVKVAGTIRSDYITVKDGNDLSLTDNVYIENYDWFSFFQLKWDATQIGRTIRIANFTESGAAISAPSSSVCFYTKGIKVSMITVAPGRCVILHGLGHDGKFIAWCVENTYTYQDAVVKRDMKYISRGTVEYNPSTKSISLTQFTVTSNTGADASITAYRVSIGLYRLTLPYAIAKAYANSSASGELLIRRIGVMVTGFGFSYSEKDATSENPTAPIKATVKDIYWNSSKTVIYIDIWTSDDATVNDGSFQYLIYNMDSQLE